MIAQIPPHEDRAWRLLARRCSTLTEALVVAELHECRRKFGRCSPSVVNLAQRIGRSTRSVIRATSALVERGHLRRHTDPPRYDIARGWFRRRTNMYSVTFPPRNAWSHRGDMADTSTSSDDTDPRPAGVPVDIAAPPAAPTEPVAPDPPPDHGPPLTIAAIRAALAAGYRAERAERG